MQRALLVCLAAMFLFALGALAVANVPDSREAFDKEAYYEAVAAKEMEVATRTQLDLLKAAGYYDGDGGSGNEIDNQGGPDGAGYIWKDSEEPDGPTYEWIDITGTGTSVIADLSDDDTVGPFDIGFDFPFYGTSENQFWVQSNGVISFFSNYVSLWNDEMPSDSYDAMIGWFWDDLDPANGGSGADILYENMTLDGQDALVIEFFEMDEFPDGPDVPTMTAEMILFADGTVKLQYMNVDNGWDIGGGTIGIQSDGGEFGLTALHNGSINGYPYNELAIEFYMADPDASVSGYVYDEADNQPIQGATVTIGIGSDVTDASGFYEIPEAYSGTNEYLVVADNYFDESGTLTLEEGANTHDFYLEWYTTEGDILIWDGDETPGSAAAIEEILNDFGFETYYTTQFDEVEWNEYMAVFVFLGVYPNYYPIYTDDPEETVMVNYLNSGGSLYIEGNDIFGFNSPQNLLALLPLTNIADGSADLSSVEGVDGSYMEGANMTYAGENNYIDEFNGTGSAIDILFNPSDGAGCGTIDNGEDYNTACFSFEVGNLVDGADDPNTREYLIEGLLEHWEISTGPVDFSLTGTNTVIPPEGGTVTYDVSLVSELPYTIPGLRYWTDVILPNGQTFGPLFSIPFTHTPFMDVTVIGMQQIVPALAPGGTYTYTGYVGFYPDPLLDDDFTFEKVGAGADGAGGYLNKALWPASGDWTAADGTAETVSALPERYQLGEAYPNPFNPSTTLRVALPEAAELELAVYNVAGQRVTTLQNGRLGAGEHTFTFDANGLASGIYFLHAVVPGELDAVRKLTLMK
ncbi:MAG: hypothetical protein MAG453_01621 [Calditrichaeota bacterium]|nr:hypothetical protein [Calditrichota bacterium]